MIHPTPAYIGLGANLGDRQGHLDEAVSLIGSIPGVSLRQCSGTFLTEPQGLKDQPWFANRVLKISCSPGISSQSLLDYLQQIETRMGRVRSIPDGPRIIDLDLLLFGSEVSTSQTLTIPHPRMRKRAFVLVPLLEISPDLVLPDGQTVNDALKQIRYTRVEERIWQDDPGRIQP
ncbi:MAG: 2-amino-4-hydroxy-6-hydroxymethyldihydropteridine diphosphokinase [Desulfovibrionales bacterium]